MRVQTLAANLYCAAAAGRDRTWACWKRMCWYCMSPISTTTPWPTTSPQVVESFDVDLILDTGDLTDWDRPGGGDHQAY